MTTVILLALLAMSTARAAAQPEQIVVFVCEHGAAKSVVAAAQFNRLAAERALPFRAVARGTAPDAAVPSRITEGLARDGLRLPDGFAPTALSETDIAAAARVVTLDVTLPAMDDAARVRRWDGVPAFSDGYDAASRAIAAKVESLIRELEQTATATSPAR